MSKLAVQRTGEPRPPRTLGIALAIIASVMLFTVLPLLQTTILLLVRARVANALSGVNGVDGQILVGGNLLGVPTAALMVESVGGILFLLLAIVAWRGGKPRIRPVFMAFVVILLILTLVLTYYPQLFPIDPLDGFDSGRGVAQALNCARLPFTLGIPLYTLWYLNRGPARAFFRGYYLERPDRASSADAQPDSGQLRGHPARAEMP